jgi:hypothetical protein
MEMGPYEILICSPVDYERLVADVTHNNAFCFRISEEGAPGTFDVELIPSEMNQMVRLPADELVNVIHAAVKHLRGPPP